MIANAKQSDIPIYPLQMRFDVSAALRDIKNHPQVWNVHRMRKDVYVHNQMSDIWVRYNAIENMGPHFNDEHISVWYPEAKYLPSVVGLVDKVYEYVGGKQLGGVLITKIPPGGRVEPHVDGGWHACYYEKFAVQLKGNLRQAFHFEEVSLSAMPGELYTFDNSRTHWVTNDSMEDRITLIICIKR